ncbi:hypothetical protein EHF33_04690 [Deinococcus psychrotolerans]|uniref:Uncharacterized protein n=1 Tax=Deinococcus psychrotolerans TaxID=2489213 RepID=A0A3G8Y9T9_9DEIO|nr:hypothetical protein [Deinococcus psychrotolerans]AZI42128.1 hypothetical protein EHF33_04690 [Deinococcus psychrotolerans]
MSKFTIGLVGASLLLSACGGGGGSPGGGGNPGGGSGGGSGPNAGAGTTITRAQLAGCANLSGSSDPAASRCLAGTLVGKTAGGDVCKLIIKSDNSYDYSTAKLNYSYSYNNQDRTYFDKDSQFPLLIWSVTSNAESYRSLEFKYGFNSTYDIQVDAEKDGVKSTCTATI